MEKKGRTILIIILIVIAINIIIAAFLAIQASTQKTLTGSAGNTGSISITILGAAETANVTVTEAVIDGRGGTFVGAPQKEIEHCYNGIKDYDESAVDCGGSCGKCPTLEEKISLTIEQYIPENVMALILILMLVLCAYLIYRIIDIILKIFELRNKYFFIECDVQQ